MEQRLKLSKESTSPPVDATQYRSMAGSLRYLVNTRPDISYAVAYLSRLGAGTYGACPAVPPQPPSAGAPAYLADKGVLSPRLRIPVDLIAPAAGASGLPGSFCMRAQVAGFTDLNFTPGGSSTARSATGAAPGPDGPTTPTPSSKHRSATTQVTSSRLPPTSPPPPRVPLPPSSIPVARLL
uniref:Uncharacterized protein n=1 Tax=Oryza brachyantha TaxID=4533 RepID=J3MIT8_ORYBR